MPCIFGYLGFRVFIATPNVAWFGIVVHKNVRMYSG